MPIAAMIGIDAIVSNHGIQGRNMAKFGIGQAVRRVEDQRFLTGAGRYVDDITLPGMCHGVVLLSPHAHARIKKVDVIEGEGRAGRAAGADRRRRRIISARSRRR